MTHILDTDIEKLREDQLKALEEHVEKVFNEILELFKNGEYKEIENKYMKFSGSGDGWGSDNYFIDFSWNNEVKDISDIIEMAKKLKENTKLKELLKECKEVIKNVDTYYGNYDSTNGFLIVEKINQALGEDK